MSHNPLVMVVEDDEEMNELQRELLALYGLDAVAAHNGAEAMEVYQRCNADAVLLDVMLPEMDGFETCRRLCQKCRRHLPVVIVTALDSDDCRRRSFEVGADAYFTKPFDPDEVIKTIWRLIDELDENRREGCD